MSTEQELETIEEVFDITLPSYIQRASKAASMFQKQMGAMIASRVDEAVLFSNSFDSEIFREHLQLNQAVFGRILDTRKSWYAGSAAVIQEYRELKRVNTLSKYVEQECNIIGSWTNLITQQITNWAELMENIQINYEYWVSQKMKQSKD